eukprot:EG_transcript_21268
MPSTTESAYIKVILHSIKFPSAPICGLLLGTFQNDEVTVIDALPLFHEQPSLLPMFDVAIFQAKALTIDKGVQVVGCYGANELFNDDQVSKASSRIMNRIKDAAPNAIFWQVINSKITHKSNATAVSVYSASKKGVAPATDGSLRFFQTFKWKADGPVSIPIEGVARRTRHAIQSRLSDTLVDFDEHLQAIDKDISNEKLNAKLATAAAAEYISAAIAAAVWSVVAKKKAGSK